MKQYLVVGLGRFGKSVARTLYDHGENVLAIDTDEDIIQETINNNIVDNAIIVDATDINALKNLGINNFDVAFVCIGTNIEASILITLSLKEIGISKVIAKALTEEHGKVLSRVGADEVVFPEKYMGQRVALFEIEPNVIEHMKLSDDHLIVELKAPAKFVNKTLISLNLRKTWNVNIIAIRNGSDMEIVPDGNTVIDKDDVLVIITDIKTAEKLNKLS